MQSDNVLEALSKAANEEPVNVRRTKILSEIADLQRMDKEESNDEVHFYLHLRCKDCNLYITEQETKRKG